MSFLIPGFNDVVDIIIIAFLVYQSLLLIKKTGSYYILYVILLFFSIYLLSKLFKLELINGLLSSFKSIGILIIVILFQKELRELVSKINLNSELMSKSIKNANKEINSTLIDAISAMSFRKIGALIVIERKAKLNEFVNVGEFIDSVVTLRLILSIFNTKSVLHDGALIIREGRIVAAKVVLPLSKNIEYKQKYGTRHLAAVGISEVSDALAIVVSEQTGRVSIADNGVLTTDVPFEELMQIISDATKL